MEEKLAPLIVAPSLLSADFCAIAEGLEKISLAGAPWVHLDVMDGHFVPNLTFGPKMIADIRKRSTAVLDTHLMIEKPELSWEQYADAGSDYITFHLETCIHAERLLKAIKARGIKAGISVVPSTPIAAIQELLFDLDLVLIMTVNPGFGGQELLPRALEKVNFLRAFRAQHQLNFKIALDGGINKNTMEQVMSFVPDVVVSGNAFFQAPDPRALVNSMIECHKRYLLELNPPKM